MTREDLVPVGVILKPHGLRGHVVFKFYEDTLDIERIDHFFVGCNGTFLPYFVEEVKSLPRGYKIKFEEINKPEEAETLINLEVFLKKDDFQKLQSSEINTANNVRNYQVYLDTKTQFLGVVSSVIENKYQDVLSIEHRSGKNILIPFVDVFIKEINRQEEFLILDLPEGLVELYTGEGKK